MKKVLKITSLIVLFLVLIIGIYIIQNYSFQKSFEDNYQKEKIRDTQDFIRCNYNLLNPEFAFLFDLGEGEDKHIAFHKTKNLLSLTEEEWDTTYTGGTTITNTTFPELMKMVKEDCSQFQQGGRNGKMEWIYSPAQAREEIDKDKIDQLEYRFSGYGNDTKEAFIEAYGDIARMSDEEKMLLFDRIETEGLEASVDKPWQVDILLEDLAYMTESQRAAIRKRYGDWKGMSVDELFEWGTKLGQDIEGGKFNPDDY